MRRTFVGSSQEECVRQSDAEAAIARDAGYAPIRHWWGREGKGHILTVEYGPAASEGPPRLPDRP